jgi:uncharacterized protein YjbI with pentapeptide repeats
MAEAATTEKFDIRSRWSDRIKFTAEITCAPDATIGVKIGLAVQWARNNDADLRDADLRDAVLRDAVLSGADLSDAVLSDAVLSCAVLRGAVLSGADLSGADLSDADLSCAVLRGAVLRGADLSGADLSDAVLSDADLRGADLSGAVLRGADLSGAPKIENIHQKVYAAASAEGALDMGTWHKNGYCGTTHCRAGWVVVLAGEEGKALENRIGTAAAASLIYLASDPAIDKFPSFYASDTAALEDMKRMAELEAEKAA